MSQGSLSQLDGRWVWLQKLTLATYPIVLTMAFTWAIWVTVSIFHLQSFASQGPRWTAKDAEIQTGCIRDWVNAKFIAEVPPQSVISRLDKLDALNEATRKDVQANSLTLASISTRLNGLIESTMGHK